MRDSEKSAKFITNTHARWFCVCPGAFHRTLVLEDINRCNQIHPGTTVLIRFPGWRSSKSFPSANLYRESPVVDYSRERLPNVFDQNLFQTGLSSNTHGFSTMILAGTSWRLGTGQALPRALRVLCHQHTPYLGAAEKYRISTSFLTYRIRNYLLMMYPGDFFFFCMLKMSSGLRIWLHKI